MIIIFTQCCKKEPDVFIEGKDISVVYCILNPADTFHYVRIQKALLTRENALVAASQTASNQYLDSLSVRIYATDSYGATITNMNWNLEKTYINKDSVGDFSWEEPFPVFCFEQIFNINDIKDKIFHLEITNNQTGNQIFGSTYIVNDIVMTNPVFDEDYPKFDIPYSETSESIVINQALHGKRYEASVTFEYDEYQGTQYPYGNVERKIVKWDQGTRIYEDDPDEEHSKPVKIHFRYTPLEFYQWLQTIIPENNNVTRMPCKFEFNFWSCTSELNTYMEVSQIMQTINQDMPFYTNLTTNTDSKDVYGIFACRYNKFIKNIPVGTETRQNLANKIERRFVTTLN